MSASLIQNYWLTAVRSLAADRSSALISLFGLVIGLAGCVILLAYVSFERSYDSWLPDAGRTFQVQTWTPHPPSGDPIFSQMAPFVAKAALTKDYPQIERAGYALSSSPVILQNGQASTAEDYVLTDDDLLQVLRLPLVSGVTLTAPQTAVLSKSEAVRRFGTLDAVGRRLTIVSNGNTQEYTIVGVFSDIPSASHLRLNGILRTEFASYWSKDPAFLTQWGWQSGWIYIRLKPGADVAMMEDQEPAWEERNIPDEAGDGGKYNLGEQQDWHFVNVRSVHLGRAQNGAMSRGNDERTIVTFGIIALLVLAMAIINYINLSTARATLRAKEIAMRKILGASRGQIVIQYLIEAILLCLLAMSFALVVVWLCAPLLFRMLQTPVELPNISLPVLILGGLSATVLIGTLSGIYPALVLSSVPPGVLLKADQAAGETMQTNYLRLMLVVFQFAVAIGLIICTTVVYQQTSFAFESDPGYQRSNLIQVRGLGKAELYGRGELIADEIRKLPGVLATGRSDIGISTSNSNVVGVSVPGDPRFVEVGNYLVDTGFKDAIGLRLIAGRWFDHNRIADDQTVPMPADIEVERKLAARGINVVINETAVRKMGFASNDAAIGKVLRTEIFSPGSGSTDLTVIGVVADTQFDSVRDGLKPLMFRAAKEGPSFLIVRFKGDPSATMQAIEASWQRVARDIPFEAQFSDDIVSTLYAPDRARAKIFTIFTLLSAGIGCLGLFTLAVFMAERRTKEIGIRKVLGASSADIAKMMLAQVLKPVLFANLLGWPVAWWLMRDWLNGFDQRIPLSFETFVYAAMISLIIAAATVITHTLKVSRMSPIHALRYE